MVSDAIRCMKAVRAWPKINLEMLNDLAQHFPQQAQQLLLMIRLEVGRPLLDWRVRAHACTCGV